MSTPPTAPFGSGGPATPRYAPSAGLPLTSPVPPRFTRRLRLLKWITTTVPALAVFSFETVRHQVFGGAGHSELGNIIVGLVALALSFGFSQVVFAIISRMQGELLRRNSELAALNTVATVTGASLDVGEVIRSARDALQAIFVADQVEIVPPTARDERADASGTTAGADGHSIGDAQPADPQLPNVPTSQISAPLRYHDRPLGTVTVVRPGRPFSDGERQLLRAAAHTLSMAIANARLHQRVHEAAVIEERERIAREMHDGVAQVLAYVLVQLGTIDGLIAHGSTAAAREEVEKLRASVEQAYADVREAIAGLRLVDRNTDARLDLVALLGTYISDFEDRTGMRTQLVVEGDPSRRLPRQHELQLLRIAQEAMANVRKHARATSLTIRLAIGPDAAVLTIEDDGHGFNPRRRDAPAGHHFGLLTMRERAEGLGGQLTVASAPGRGTRVRAEVPLPEEQEIPFDAATARAAG